MENNEIGEVKKEMYLKIVITEAICVAFILLTLLSTKLFFGNIFSDIKKWYIDNMCIDTDVNQVLEAQREAGDISEV